MTLDKKFIEKQKASLVAEKQRLEDEIKSVAKYPNYGDQDDDNAQELVDFEKNISLEGGLQKTLKQVKTALTAIEKGTYGKCSKCGELIENSRLVSMSYADVCATCKSKTK